MAAADVLASQSARGEQLPELMAESMDRSAVAAPRFSSWYVANVKHELNFEVNATLWATPCSLLGRADRDPARFAFVQIIASNARCAVPRSG
jgi:hypothetical protein